MLLMCECLMCVMLSGMMLFSSCVRCGMKCGVLIVLISLFSVLNDMLKWLLLWWKGFMLSSMWVLGIGF